jgi:hypothetical protein
MVFAFRKEVPLIHSEREAVMSNQVEQQGVM